MQMRPQWVTMTVRCAGLPGGLLEYRDGKTPDECDPRSIDKRKARLLKHSGQALLSNALMTGLISMRHTLRFGLLTLTLSVGFVSVSAAETRPAVLELFTSEGCSS